MPGMPKSSSHVPCAAKRHRPTHQDLQPRAPCPPTACTAEWTWSMDILPACSQHRYRE